MLGRTPENKNWRSVVHEDCECEGFDQAFVNYSDYSWIQDEVFQEKRKAYLEAREDLMAYVGYSE